MVRLYSINDLIPVKIKDITVIISPMKYKDRHNLELLMRQSTDNDFDSTINAAKYALKCSIKNIIGIDGQDDKPYKLTFDDDGYLNDSCVEDLLSIPLNNELITICSSLLNGIPDAFLNPYTGKPMKGVEIVKEGINDPLVVGV